jgi:hypothetical protein
MNKLPKYDYFQSGNTYSGSKTTENGCFNYFVEFKGKYICKTWMGLSNSETAENFAVEEFENLDELSVHLEKQLDF